MIVRDRKAVEARRAAEAEFGSMLVPIRRSRTHAGAVPPAPAACVDSADAAGRC